MKAHHLAALLSFAVILPACSTAPPPPPVQRSPAISLKPIVDSNARIQTKATTIGDLNNKTRVSLDKAIVALHQAQEEAQAQEIDREKLNSSLAISLQAAQDAKETADRLQTEKDDLLKEAGAQAASTALLQAQAEKDHALAEHNADLADQRGAANAKYVAQEKADDEWWGWHGVARSIGHALIRSAWKLFLFVGLPMLVIIGGLLLLNAFVPGLPIVTRILGALAKIPIRIMAALAALWPKPPPK